MLLSDAIVYEMLPQQFPLFLQCKYCFVHHAAIVHQLLKVAKSDMNSTGISIILNNIYERMFFSNSQSMHLHSVIVSLCTILSIVAD